VLVTGANSLWHNSGNLSIGTLGAGNQLVITNGGRVNAANVNIGPSTGAGGHRLVVTGSNSLLNITGDLGVANVAPSNRVTVSDGGVITSGSTVSQIGGNSAGNVVLVTDPGSRWTMLGQLDVGFLGDGNMLIVSNAGAVSTGGNALIGRDDSSERDQVIVTGSTSRWDVARTLTVGNLGSNCTLLVSDDGTVTASNLIVGASATAINNAVIVTNGGSLFVTNALGQGLLSLRRGTVTVDGSTLTANRLLVSNSTTLAVNNGTITVAGILTNHGTVTMTNAVGRFAGPVVNDGAWITDPTTNIFQSDYTATPNDYIQMSAGDVYVFSNAANFVNLSTQSNQFDTLAGTFLFNSDPTATQSFTVAGLNLGNLDTDGGLNTVPVPTLDPDLLPQFSNNFALGTLIVDPPFQFSLIGPDSGPTTHGLFLTNLVIDPGASILISNNVQVYFVTSNGWNSSQITLVGNAGLHQLVLDVVVPEPSIFLLCASGLAALSAVRRRLAR